MTDRILKAMDDPRMAIMGHPTGRLLLSRDPYPLDLTVHVPQHADPDLFNFISRGFPGTAMPAWSDADHKLTNDQIWHLVNFLRTFTPVDR